MPINNQHLIPRKKKNSAIKYETITLKYWKKKLPSFSERVKEIEGSTYPLTEKEWKDPKISQKQNEIFFIHFETDIPDDSLGIDVENAKRFFAIYSKDELIKLFNIVNYVVRESSYARRLFVDEDGFFNWDSFSSEVLLVNNKDSVALFLSFIEGVVIPSSMKIDDKLTLFDITPSFINNLKLAIEFGYVDKITANISVDAFLEKRERLWIESVGRAPKINGLLLANPKNFSKKFIAKIQDVYEEKDLKNLDKEIQLYIGALLNNFGENICHFDNEIIKSGLNRIPFSADYNLQLFSKKLFLSFSKTVEDSRRALKLLSSLNDDDIKTIMKKGSFSESDMKSFSYKNNFYASIQESNHYLFDKLSFENWKMVQRYGSVSSPQMTPNELLQAITLFNENKNNNQNIPIISGSVGSYDYQILEKSNILGLFLGYATDCCMVFGGQHSNGRSCLVAGYEREDSAFFVVTKGKTVYAQSWCWENDKLFSFDSLEVLGKHSGSYSDDIIKCYQEASKKLIEHGYDKVTIGTDGNNTPQALVDSGLESFHRAPEEYLCPIDNVYSDIDYVEGRDNEDAIKLIIVAKKD